MHREGKGAALMEGSLPSPLPHPASPRELLLEDDLFAHKSKWNDKKIIQLAENDWLIRK